MTKKQRSAIFRRAAELVRAGWCKRSLAKTKSGTIVDPLDSGARKFCIMGAIFVAINETLGVVPKRLPSQLLRKAEIMVDSDHIGKWNDSLGRKKAEVVELLERLAVIEAGKWYWVWPKCNKYANPQAVMISEVYEERLLAIAGAASFAIEDNDFVRFDGPPKRVGEDEQ